MRRTTTAFAFICGVACAVACLVALRAWPARAARTHPQPRISARIPLYVVERHFGHPTSSQVRGAALTNAYVSREHNWTIVLYVHPIPRRRN